MLHFKDNKSSLIIEYAIILILVAVIVATILALIGPEIAKFIPQS